MYVIHFRKDGREYTFDKPVEGTQAVEIFDPVKLLPESVVLPWQSSGRNVRFNFVVRILIVSFHSCRCGAFYCSHDIYGVFYAVLILLCVFICVAS